jgi:Lrp/AsnC family transcriptional regulator, regulator for asnA, asnC and gidA
VVEERAVLRDRRDRGPDAPGTDDQHLHSFGEDPRFGCPPQGGWCALPRRDGCGLTECTENGRNRLALRRIEAEPSSVAERRGPVRGSRRIDALDQGIVEALQANGRESFRRIAERLGVSEATVRARYTRLSADDILQVVGVTNPLALGFEQALIGVKTAGSPQPVADEIASWLEADYVVVTAGQYDLVVEVLAADRRGLLEITNRMRALQGVVSTETFLYLDLVKQLYDWGTRVGAAK